MTDTDSIDWIDLFEIIQRNDERCKKAWNESDELNNCDHHFIKHHEVAGGCPMCMLKTILKERQRLEYESKGIYDYI